MVHAASWPRDHHKPLILHVDRRCSDRGSADAKLLGNRLYPPPHALLFGVHFAGHEVRNPEMGVLHVAATADVFDPVFPFFIKQRGGEFCWFLCHAKGIRDFSPIRKLIREISLAIGNFPA
jgi:hypothetical protein